MERYIYTVDKKDITIDKGELALRLKTPRGYTDDLVERCISEVFASVKPACCYARLPLALKEDGVDLGFAFVKSQNLRACLKGCAEGYVMASTLGVETDRLIGRKSLVSPVEGFVTDAIASAVAEAVMDNMYTHLSADLRLTARFSPGYGDLELAHQRDVLDFLCADKLIGIKLGDNLIMTPRKSITAICGIKE